MSALPNLFTPQPGDINTAGIEVGDAVGTQYGTAAVRRVNGSSVFVETQDGLLVVFRADAVTPLWPEVEPGDMLAPELEEVDFIEVGDAVTVTGGEVAYEGFVIEVDAELQYALINYADPFSNLERFWWFPAERLERRETHAAAETHASTAA